MTRRPGGKLSSTAGNAATTSPATSRAGYRRATSSAPASRASPDASGGAHASSQDRAAGSRGSRGLRSIPTRPAIGGRIARGGSREPRTSQRRLMAASGGPEA